MPLQAIEPQRRYQQVADQLAELIRRGEFTVGQRLPPERDLAKKLGVSRPVVREALVALEIAHLVEVRTGMGAFVKAAKPAPMADAGPSPFDLIAARKAVEGETAALAASAKDRAGLLRLGEAVADDRAFHVGVAAAAGNSVLASIVESLWLGMHQPVFVRLSARTGLPFDPDRVESEHRAVVDAILAGDAEAARTAMRAHLAAVEAAMLGDVGL
jgi:DNA-binding FadR family transcriptional regulator